MLRNVVCFQNESSRGTSVYCRMLCVYIVHGVSACSYACKDQVLMHVELPKKKSHKSTPVFADLAVIEARTADAEKRPW